MAKPQQPPGGRPKPGGSGTAPAKPGPAKPGPATARTPAARTPAARTPAARTPAARTPAAPTPADRTPKSAPARARAAVAPAVRLPRSVQIAVWLMYAGAGLSALDLIATLATAGSARGELHRANPAWTAAQLTSGVHSFIASLVVSWAVTIAVWLIMARTNSAGRAWARNVATVLSALSTVSFLLYLHEPGSLLVKLLLVPMWLVGVAAAALLWRRESAAYIRAGRA